MPRPTTVITHPCEHRGIFFAVGDVVDQHDQADFLVRLGFAEHTSPAAADSVAEETPTDTEPVSTTRRRTPAASPQEA